MNTDKTYVTDSNGMRTKLVYTDTILPDHLVDLYTRCVGLRVRSKVDNLDRPPFSVRQNMLKVP